MTQLHYPPDKAHDALDAFLTREGGERSYRWVSKENGDADFYILPAEQWDKVSNGYSEWVESQEVRGDDPAASYQPWRHSPLANTDRLLPVEPLEDPLAHYMFGKKYAELEEPERHRVHVTAITCLLRVTLDPDGHGAVPVMMRGHDPDEPGPSLRWQTAFVTSVPGLFLRATGNGFFGDEWAIVTGSGYRLASGWFAREDAEAAVAALGRVLPNADWMRLTPEGFTPKAKAAITAVIKRYHYAGLYEKAPEPEVMPDPVPPAEGEAVKPEHEPALD